jgi:hypothetical protein
MGALPCFDIAAVVGRRGEEFRSGGGVVGGRR